jgi:hypothetical protein
MPFQYILANLLAANENAIGVLFLDDSGETVDFAAAEFEPYDLKVVGAYLGIHLRQLDRMLEENDLGDSEVVHIEHRAMHVFASKLPDGYSLVLVQRAPAMVSKTRRSLAEAAHQMRAALFA